MTHTIEADASGNGDLALLAVVGVTLSTFERLRRHRG